MKTLIERLTRRQRCACGRFKLARAEQCFDCTLEAQRLDYEEWRHTAI